MKKVSLLFSTALLTAVVFAACTVPGMKKDEVGMENENAEAIEMEQHDASTSEEGMMDDKMMAASEAAMMQTDDKMMDDEMMEAADVTLDATNFKYAPNTITAKAGETITVKLNVAEGFHDFVIDELDVATKQLQAGNSEVVTIAIPEDAAGKEFEFYCSVGKHREMGMVGSLVVE